MESGRQLTINNEQKIDFHQIQNFPTEVLLEIFAYLDTKSLIKMRDVCKLFKEIIDNNFMHATFIPRLFKPIDTNIAMELVKRFRSTSKYKSLYKASQDPQHINSLSKEEWIYLVLTIDDIHKLNVNKLKEAVNEYRKELFKIETTQPKLFNNALMELYLLTLNEIMRKFLNGAEHTSLEQENIQNSTEVSQYIQKIENIGYIIHAITYVIRFLELSNRLKLSKSNKNENNETESILGYENYYANHFLNLAGINLSNFTTENGGFKLQLKERINFENANLTKSNLSLFSFEGTSNNFNNSRFIPDEAFENSGSLKLALKALSGNLKKDSVAHSTIKNEIFKKIKLIAENNLDLAIKLAKTVKYNKPFGQSRKNIAGQVFLRAISTGDLYPTKITTDKDKNISDLLKELKLMKKAKAKQQDNNNNNHKKKGR